MLGDGAVAANQERRVVTRMAVPRGESNRVEGEEVAAAQSVVLELRDGGLRHRTRAAGHFAA